MKPHWRFVVVAARLWVPVKGGYAEGIDENPTFH